MAGFCPFNLEDLLIELLCFRRYLPGNPELDPYQEIARPPPAADPFARDLQGGIMLDPRRNREDDLLLPDRLDLNLGSHDRLGWRDLRCCLEVVSLADKPLVWLHRDLDEKVAIGGSDIPGFPI